MLHAYLGDAKFWGVLFRIDEDLAAEARAGGCRHCGAVLHAARYPRKPRGARRALLGPEYAYRLSLCCARDGCRRRTTPASVRFLGRRVYLGAVVVLVSALAQGLTERRLVALRERFGVDPRTVRRWRCWWAEAFAASRFWHGARGEFVAVPETPELPGALLARWGDGAAPEAAVSTLKFLCPITVP